MIGSNSDSDVRGGTPSGSTKINIEGPVQDSELITIPGFLKPSATYFDVGILQLVDIVGTGILALGSGLAVTGTGTGLFLLIFFLLVNVYGGYILKYAYLLYPSTTYIGMSTSIWESRKWLGWVIGFFWYTFLLGVMGAYMQVIGSSLGALIPNLGWCGYQYTLLGILPLIPMLQFRNLADSSLLQIFNTISITLVIVISISYMWTNWELRGEITERSFTWTEWFNAISKFIFATQGNFIYLSFLSEMKEPQTFGKSFLVSTPYQLVFYALASTTQYYFLGTDAAFNSGSLIFESIPTSNPLYGACSMLLFLHMLCAYLVKGTIFARIVHKRVHPATANSDSWCAKGVWFFITLGTALFAFLIASVIPNFSALMGWLGSCNAPLLGFFFPPLFVMGARRKAGLSIGKSWEVALLCSLVVLGFVLFVVGIVASAMTIQESFKQGETPFNCNT